MSTRQSRVRRFADESDWSFSVPKTSSLSGMSVTTSGMYLFTVSEGKIISYALELDQIGLLRQLGWTFTPPGTS